MARQNEPDELDQRRRKLEDALAAHKPSSSKGGNGGQAGNAGKGIASAFKLSGEFLAGIIVGIGLGWFFDRIFDTSPWGLIVFLLLGFGAGILNVLRAAGQVAEFGSNAPKNGSDDSQRK